MMAILSALLSAPAWAIQGSNLPVCCRKNGRHKCAMTQEIGKAHLSSVSAKCPCTANNIAPGELLFDVVANNSKATTTLLPVSEILAQVEAGFRISSIRSRQKRGPPALLNS